MVACGNTSASPVSPAPPRGVVFASLVDFASPVTPIASDMPGMWMRQRCKVPRLGKAARAPGGRAAGAVVTSGVGQTAGDTAGAACQAQPQQEVQGQPL